MWPKIRARSSSENNEGAFYKISSVLLIYVICVIQITCVWATQPVINNEALLSKKYGQNKDLHIMSDRTS